MTTQIIKRDTDVGTVLTVAAQKPAGELLPAFLSLNRLILKHQLNTQVIVSTKLSVGVWYETIETSIPDPDRELAIDLYMWEQEFK